MAIDRKLISSVITGDKALSMMKVVSTNLTPSQRLSVRVVQTRPIVLEDGTPSTVDIWSEILSPRPVDPMSVDVRTGDIVTVNNVRGRESGLIKTIALWGDVQPIGRFNRAEAQVEMFGRAAVPAAE